MKKVALALAAVMSAALVVPLAACGGGGFDIGDYAVDVEEYAASTTSGKEFTSSTTIDGTVTSPFYGATPIVLVKQNDASRFYNIETGEYVGTSFTEYQSIGSTPFIAIGSTADGYRIYNANGESVFANTFPMVPSVTNSQRVIGGKVHTLYTFSYVDTMTDGSGTVTAYKFGTFDRETEDGPYVWQEYTQDEVLALSDVSVGDTVDAYATARTALGSSYRKTPLDAYEYTSYSSNDGTVYRFFEEGKFSGEFVLPKNAQLIGGSVSSSILGTSVFYATTVPVDNYAQDGFNYIAGGQKVEVTYYRYDIASDSEHEIKTDYIFTGFDDVLYNYDAEEYGAAVVSAIPKKNGVANSTDRDTKTLIVDVNGKVAEDISGLPFSLDSTIYKLKSNRYFVGGASSDYSYIIDGSLEIVAVIGNATPAFGANGIVFTGSNNLRGLVDYDGKVVLDNVYSELSFTGAKGYAAAVFSPYGNIEAEEVIVSTDGSYRTLQSAFGLTDTELNTTTVSGGFVIKTGTTGATVYNLSGTVLASSETATGSSMTRVTSYKGFAIYNFGGKFLRLA